MPHKIAVIYTTFLRAQLVSITLPSVINFLRCGNFDCVLVGNQIADARAIDDSGHLDGYNWSADNVHVITLPFDCGLSRARNELVRLAEKRGADYCIITADSIRFSHQMLNLGPVLEFLDADPRRAIVGFELIDRIHWVHHMDLKDGTFLLTPAREVENYRAVQLTRCDMCPNFFIAKTGVLRDVQWDNELKLCEHEDFFWRIKQGGWKTYWTDYVRGHYVECKPPIYDAYRNRLYGEFREKLMKKYNLTKWFKVMR